MKYYFTITAGRTGTAWLASFLSKNLKIISVHEHLEINDLGEKMPDIRTMRNFNNFGNNDFVKSFWNRKFANIPNEDYAETNHTLCKCGLVENIVLNNSTDNTTIILLKRNLIKQCASYVTRNDFDNILSAWSWYLHPSYKKKIVNPDPFMKFGNLAIPIWYCFEMEARQEYYRQMYSNKIKMVEVKLEELVSENGANKFYSELGFKGNCFIPPPKNINKKKQNDKVINILEKIFDKINVDMQKLVSEAIKDGITFI
ncbi:hypothetical protein OA517_01975 [Alphaproteobacteria bacterium]|nr:hypothetical protein [Alphaproteobacteria bacterium]